MNETIKKIFCFIWRKRFDNEDTLIKITGWNKAIIENRWGQRKRVAFLLGKGIKR